MVLGGLEVVKFKNKVNGSGQECPLHTKPRHVLTRKRPRSFLNVAFDLMPATTYSPTHFRVQYHRPSGA